MTDLQVSQAFTLAVVETPASAAMRVSQSFVLAPVRTQMNIRVSQAFVLAVVKSRPHDPTVRAWTFASDGHDFYVLRLGDTETLIYDFHAKEWYVWGNGDTNLWAVLDGINWNGGHNYSPSFGSNVLVGSDTNGALYFLDPEGTNDDNATTGSDDPEPFLRETMGQVVVLGYDAVPCFGVELYGSVGDVRAPNPTDVTLEISDNRGFDWLDCGTVSITADDYTARVSWTSLGSMVAPGRLFKISDYGALHRIDALEMQDPPDASES